MNFQDGVIIGVLGGIAIFAIVCGIYTAWRP